MAFEPPACTFSLGLRFFARTSFSLAELDRKWGRRHSG